MRKNLIIVLIIIGLFGGGLGYQIKTVDAAAIIGDPWQFLKEFVIKPLVRTIANSLENKIVNSLNKQISNIDGKSPSFITNWRNHFLDSQGRGNDVFRSVLADTKLCGYFDENLKTAFGAEKFMGSIAGATTKNSAGQVVYQNKTTVPGLPSFQQMGNCTLPSNFNVNTFRTDFAGGGGWNTWNKLIEPQNNFYGAYSLALGEQQRQMAIEEQVTMDSAVAGQGFLSQKLGVGSSGLGPTGCANQPGVRPPGFVGPMPVVPRCIFIGKEVTPAQILGKTAAGSIDTKLKRPGAATELTDIILSLFAAVVNGTTNRLANYIGQATYDRPPQPPEALVPDSGGYDTQQFQPGASDPNFDSETDSMYQNVRQGCMDSCSRDCESSTPQECITDPVTEVEQCTQDQSALDACRQNCEPQCNDSVPGSGI